MNIKELLKSDLDVTVNLSLGDLRAFGKMIVSEAREMLAEGKQEKEEHLTIEETAKKLHVTKPTLWRWAKDGYLVPVEVGRKRFYRVSDINRIMGGK